MVSSSPEFSITKPGLHHRKRDKPLRTYGRQTSTPEAQTGPPSKKARISAERERQQQEKSASNLTSANDISNLNDDAAVAGAVEGAAHKQDASAQIKAEKPGESLKRGSILSYFKPASQPVPKADTPSPQLQDSPTEEASSPPQSSPKQQPTKRKPRLLRIKATAHEPSDQSSSSSSQETDDNPVPQKRRGRPPLKSNIISNSSDATSSNQDTTTTSSSSPSSPTKQSTTIKPKKNKLFSPAVQTTLNISAQAAFSECKICNTVWNPLYPDDVKYHIRTHKAVLRAEKKRNMDEL